MKKHKPLTFEGGVRYVESLVPDGIDTQDQLDKWLAGKATNNPVVRDLMTAVRMYGNAKYADGMVHDMGRSEAHISNERLSRLELAITQALLTAYGEGVHDGMNK
jgi:hypothetical protein